MKAQLEVIPRKINSSIHAFNYSEKSFNAPWHYHSEFELTYITRSSGVRYVGNNISSFKEGDLVLIGPSVPHAWRNAPNYADGAESIYVQWKDADLSPLFKLPEFNSVFELLEKANYGIHFTDGEASAKIGAQLANLPQHIGTVKMLSFLKILSDLATINSFELLSDPGKQLYNYQEADNRIKEIFVFIAENYTRKITINDMAELTFMTRSSFCKYFKTRFGKTFTQYLNEFRVHNSCQKLHDTNLPVSQIAMDCGFENLSYFHRQFLTIIKTTPAKYRANYLSRSF